MAGHSRAHAYKITSQMIVFASLQYLVFKLFASRYYSQIPCRPELKLSLLERNKIEFDDPFN